MPEAKRRKKLDPNWAKSGGFSQPNKPKITYLTEELKNTKEVLFAGALTDISSDSSCLVQMFGNSSYEIF